MKRIIAIISVMLVCASAANAQSLKDILGAIGKKTSEATTQEGGAAEAVGSILGSILGALTTADELVLDGTWTYTGCAIALESENVLSNIASSAAKTTLENKVNQYLEKIGIKAGVAKFTFNADGTFAVTNEAEATIMSGTWTKEESNINLQFGRTMKLLKMNGTVTSSAKNSCQLLFESTKFLKFVKNALKLVGNRNEKVQAISALLENYDNLKLGFSLTK